MEKLRVELGERSYDICIGRGLLANAAEYIRPLLPQPRVVIVTDENVAPLYLDALQQGLGDITHEAIILPAGESTKTMPHFEELLDKILSLQVDRKTTLIALGGGVIGDITGFAASVILRGVPFIQIPTTLLSQVDSSVGGKTGINSKYGKNLIGSFYQPQLVLADTDTLDTLDARELKAGYAEVVKYGLIKDAAFFDWLDENKTKLLERGKETLAYAIHKSCSIKAQVVAEDEKEHGARALLNLGHTFGHALEVEAGYGGQLLHGEAVAIGIIMAAKFSHKKGLIDTLNFERIYTHMQPLLAATCAVMKDPHTLVAHMRLDKKAEAGNIKLILLRAIGDAYVESTVQEQEILQLFEDVAGCRI